MLRRVRRYSERRDKVLQKSGAPVDNRHQAPLRGRAFPSLRANPIMTLTAAPTLLVIDTATDRCRLALSHQSAVLTFHGTPGSSHLEPAMSALDRLFAEHGIGPSACDAFVVALGPGAFTGLRVACTLVQGFAFATGRPAIGIGHLDAMAASLAGAHGPAWSGASRVVCALDARLDQAYFAVYEFTQGGWRSCQPATVGSARDLLDAAQGSGAGVIAGDLDWLSGWLGNAAPQLLPAAPSLEAMVALGEKSLLAGAVLTPEQVQPLYVRDRVAQTIAERRAARPGLAPASV